MNENAKILIDIDLEASDILAWRYMKQSNIIGNQQIMTKSYDHQSKWDEYQVKVRKHPFYPTCSPKPLRTFRRNISLTSFRDLL